ncbi:MAG: SIMPL domain-containing protein [Terriglobales bacterium]
MKSPIWSAVFVLASLTAFAQTPELKFIADTLVVQADGTYDADPDLATLTFQIFAQDKDIKRAYDTATRSMQHIVDIAQRNGLGRDDIRSGVLTVSPIYEGDRKKRARSYYVQGQEVLKVHDFAKIGPILDASVEDGVTDFRSLTYSLADEESAKKKAVAEAMQRAIGRAATALEQKGQKLGALRYMSLDVKQVYGVARLETFPTTTETVEVSGAFSERKAISPPPPPPPPQKITISASVQCAFQIQ